MKRSFLYIIGITLFFITSINAQQLPQYTQFIFNKIGYNPAASGVSVNVPFEIIFGGRAQWLGAAKNPKSEFISFNYNFVPQHSYHNWHNVGGYIAQDQNGNFVNNGIWLSYAHHLLINRKMVLSAGVFVGIKQFRLSTKNLDLGDPAVQASSKSIVAFPDIIPGLRLSSKKFFIDFSMQQLTKRSQQGVHGRLVKLVKGQIGTPSLLLPHYNISLGKKGRINDFNILTIALNVRSTFKALPSIELNIMEYYNKRIAFGASIRGRNFLCGIFQFRALKQVNIGLAYDLSINKMAGAYPNTIEVMVSLSPSFGGELIEYRSKRNLDACSF